MQQKLPAFEGSADGEPVDFAPHLRCKIS
jgi:hypothetical protein